MEESEEILDNLLFIESKIETWRIIDNHRNYAVSNYGRVCNIITAKILRQNKNTKGYLHVHLSNGKKQLTKLVHILVYEAFNKKIPIHECIHHIDRNRENNSIINLVSINKCRHTTMHTAPYKPVSEETRSKLSKIHTGKKHSLETKLKISKSKKRYHE